MARIISLVIGISHHSRQFKIQCWWIVEFGRTMSQYPPNFSYVEADKAVGLDSLDLTD